MHYVSTLYHTCEKSGWLLCMVTLPYTLSNHFNVFSQSSHPLPCVPLFLHHSGQYRHHFQAVSPSRGSDWSVPLPLLALRMVYPKLCHSIIWATRPWAMAVGLVTLSFIDLLTPTETETQVRTCTDSTWSMQKGAKWKQPGSALWDLV